MSDRQRLEAIVAVVCKYLPPDGISREEAMSQIIALVDPLPEQEPVVWIRLIDWNLLDYEREGYIPLYTTPASKTWVGLTDVEVAVYETRLSGSGLAREIEAKLRERNT